MSERTRPSCRRLTAGLALVVAGTVAVTGCIPGLAQRSAHSASPTASRANSATPTPTASGTPFDDGGEQYRFAVTALYRSGPFVRLGFALTCLKDAGDNYKSACAPWEDFGQDANDDTYGGFYLVDPVQHEEYLPVQTKKPAGGPFTSQADFIDRGKTADGWVVFPAPAQSTRSLDVMVPNGPALENVPIGQPRPETQQAPTQQNFDKPKDTTDTSGLELPVRDLKLHTVSEGDDENEHHGRKNVTLASDVLFAFGKADLTDRAKTILGHVAGEMNQNATGTVAVTGYTDAKGSPKVNKPLSRNRAKAVADYLKSKVRRNLGYSVTGKGEADPVAPNTKPDGSDNPKGRAENRRVTVSYRVQRAGTGASTTPSPTATAATSATPTPPAAITWRAHGTESEDTYRVSIQQVRRHGDVASLHLTLTCLTPDDTDQGCQPQTQLQDPDDTGILAPDRAAGFRLYEPSTKTRYYPVTENAVGAKAWTSDTSKNLDSGAEQSYWVYFPAPEPQATAVDVELPQGGPTVHDVPVV